MPVELVPVHGKVTYEDGSLIKADSILVAFNPISESSGPIVTPGGTAQVNVADGTFDAVTTRRTDDGVAIAKHRVAVTPFKKGPSGNPVPTKAIAAKYQRESTTPLEVEVTSSDQFIEIRVSKE